MTKVINYYKDKHGKRGEILSVNAKIFIKIYYKNTFF
jgi:hypothetical protein